MRSQIEVLNLLADLTVNEAKISPVKKRVFAVGGVVIGGVSCKVYFGPTQLLAQGYSQFYGTLLVVSNLSINVVVAAYYNLIASQEYFDLWDPVTDRLIIPSTHLAGIGFGSIASAFCFAFLVLDPTNLITYADFSLQLVTFATQHFFFLQALYDCLPEWPSRKQANREFRQLQSAIIDAIDVATSIASKGFYEKSLDVKEFFDEDDALNVPYLTTWIDRQKLPVALNSKPSRTSRCIYGLTQFFFVGFATTIGNIGYHNATINGFMQLKFLSLTVESAWLPATICMIPVYGLGYLATYNNIKKIFQLCSGDFTRDDVPLWIKKAPSFSAGCSTVLTAWAIFSYGSAVSLLKDAIYGGNTDNSSNFPWLDSQQHTLEDLYIYLTMLVTVFFNIFPVPEVVNFFAEKFCYYFGSKEDKQQIQVLNFLKALRNRAVKATAETISLDQKPAQTKMNGSLSEPLLTRPHRESCCQKIGRFFSSFWEKPFAKNLQQSAAATTAGLGV